MHEHLPAQILVQ